MRVCMRCFNFNHAVAQAKKRTGTILFGGGAVPLPNSVIGVRVSGGGN